WKLESMLVCLPKLADHLSGLEHAPRLPGAAIPRSADLPEVLGAAQRRGSVLRAHAVDLLPSLRIDPQDRSRTAVRRDDKIPDAQGPDRDEAVGCENTARDRLSPAAHEGQRRNLDRAALDVRVQLLG